MKAGLTTIAKPIRLGFLLLKLCWRFVLTDPPATPQSTNEHDIVLGHGSDNLSAARVITGVGLGFVGLCFWDMCFNANAFSLIALMGLFSGVVRYVASFPHSGVAEALGINAKAELNSGYRPFFGGRVLFNPHGDLSFSWHRRQGPFAPEEVIAAAAAKVAQAGRTVDAALVQELQQEIFSKTGIHMPSAEVGTKLLAETTAKTLPAGSTGFVSDLKVPQLDHQRVFAGVNLPLATVMSIPEAKASALNAERAHSVGARTLKASDVVFLGFGFPWGPKHARRIYHEMEVGLRAATFGKKGSPSIHATEDTKGFEPICLSTDLLLGHTLLLGTTGSGKTRFFDLLVSQAIMRGDTVIVIDPKGDRALQKNIIRAARSAGRNPLTEVCCLDIGRPQSPSILHEPNLATAKTHSGIVSPLGSANLRPPKTFSRVFTASKSQDIPDSYHKEELTPAALSAYEQGYAPISNNVLGAKVAAATAAMAGRTNSTAASTFDEAHVANAAAANAAAASASHAARTAFSTATSAAAASATASAAASAPTSTFSAANACTASFSAAYSAAGPDAVATARTATARTFARATAVDLEARKEQIHAAALAQSDEMLFDHINMGFNPTSAFDRATEIADRVTAMMSGDGAAANFKAYSHMAISAAVNCCLICNKKVTLENIRAIVSSFDSFAIAFRTYLNHMVIELNRKEVTVFYNRIHGITNKDLTYNVHAVSLLLGDSGEGKATKNQEEKLALQLTGGNTAEGATSKAS